MFQNPICTSWRTHYVSIVKNSQFILLRDVITVCSEADMKHSKTQCRSLVFLITNLLLSVVNTVVERFSRTTENCSML